MMVERLIRGIEASGGLASGPIRMIVPVANDDRSRRSGPPEQEMPLLDDAISKAADGLETLIGKVDEDAADILAFQLALLEDDDFLEPVRVGVRSGLGAHDAWAQSLDAEIADYQASDDEYFAARADDLKDLRDRVLGVIYGDNGPGAADVADAIIVSEELTPSQFLNYQAAGAKGFALALGSPTSHVAVLARARGTGLLVGCGVDVLGLEAGSVGLLDTEDRSLISAPEQNTVVAFERKQAAREERLARSVALVSEPAVTRDGQTVSVSANIDDPSGIGQIDVTPFDGIGLFRTEFLFSDTHIPDEEEQFAAYSRVINWAAGRPVTIRTLDAGGDKPIKGVVMEHETNPFLGVRGYRLSRQNLDLFRAQLRAVARAAALGPVKLMIPMVTAPSELEEFKALFARIVADLHQEGHACASPELGIMVEVPAVALTAELFDADFYSIGSNDLIQYTLAVARDNPHLSYLSNKWDPAISRLVAICVEAAKTRNVPLSVCGDMASQKDQLQALLKAGVRSISIAPAQVAIVKDWIRNWGETQNG